MDSRPPKTTASILTGTGVAPGIGTGRSYVRTVGLDSIPVAKIADRDADKEVRRFRRAVEQARKELNSLEERLRREGTDPGRQVEILESHRACLDDPVFFSDVEKGIRGDKLNLEASLARVISNFARIFELVENSYLKERICDIREVASRILDNLHPPGDREPPPPASGPTILVTEELRIADLLDPQVKEIAAVVAERGGRTAHASLMARSLGVPMVVGLPGVTRLLPTGTTLLVDGSVGTVYPNPPVQVRREYQEIERDFQKHKGEYGEILKDPCRTRDGRRVRLLASVANPSDLELARNHVMDGIGLYRTDYAFVKANRLPDEAALVREYTAAAAAAGDGPVVLRLLNVGSARGLAGRQLPREPNPALGRRSLRLLLADPEVFRLQIRAALGAAAAGDVRILLPFVSNLDDLRRARDFIRSVAREARRDEPALPAKPPVGVLVEIPGLVPMLPAIRKESDFLCIGIDNLAQNLMAADRANGLVEEYLQMSQPGLLRTLASIVGAAGGTEVYAYGEMVRDPLFTPLLLGIGLDRLCLPPYSMARVKSIVLQTDLAEARTFARELLAQDSTAEIRRRLAERATRLVTAAERA